jgi:exopolysaccharide biosynthesis polyprenyl glycosylphosphotransferase
MNVAPGRIFAASETLSRVAREGPSRRTLRIRMHGSLILLDFVCIVVSYLFAGWVYGLDGNESVVTVLTVLPLYFGTAFGARAFSVEVIGDPWRAVGRSLQALVISAFAVLLVAFFLKASEEFSRVVFAIGFAASAASLGIARRWFIRKARLILGGNPYSIFLITDEEVFEMRGEQLSILPASRFDPEIHCPDMYNRLAQTLRGADRVVVKCAPEKRVAWAHALKGANVQAEILAPELADIKPMAVAEFEGTPTIIVAKGPLSLPARVVKRAFDVTLAGFALLFFAPVFLLTALAIRLESPGPIFFVQPRIGRGNQMFRMFKFRSMRTESSDGRGTTSTGRDDDRITVVGRFIRKTSIDELPQLINVLSGDMSIVGPRPHALGSRAEDMLFWEIDKRYWHRHAAKPGLTGLAQVRGFRGATERRDDLTNRLQADLEYLDYWSIWRDIKIIGRTFSVLVHKNAY